MENIDLIFLFVIAAFVGYYFCKKESFDSIEEFSAINDARQAVREVYNADVDAIRNLSEVAKKLQAGGITIPGTLTANSGNHHIPIVAASNGEAHIALRSSNNEGINNYLINRGGNFRLHTHDVGDMFGVNRDGHHYIRHTGDNVMNIEGDGDNPYISLGKTGTWDNRKLYIQNVGANTADPTFRVGVHGKREIMDISQNAGVRFKRKDGRTTHLDHTDDKNYIRGDTQHDNNLNVDGNTVVNGNLEVKGRLNLSNGWNIRTNDGNLRFYHNDSHQMVIHNPQAGNEWANVIAGRRLRAEEEVRTPQVNYKNGTADFLIIAEHNHDALRIRAGHGGFADIRTRKHDGRAIDW
jgi:hypothetical protein